MEDDTLDLRNWGRGRQDAPPPVDTSGKPTRAQFDAAAKKVMSTAPGGLSREQFYGLIDRELAGTPMAPHALNHPIDESGRDISQHEPDTFWGGFGKSIKDQIVGASGMGQGMAHPQDIGDFLSLALPEMPNQLRTAIPNAAKVVKEGVSEAPGWRQIPSSIWNKIDEYVKEPDQTTLSRMFNKKPLAVQMNDLPATAAPERAAAPPFRATGQENATAKGAARQSILNPPAPKATLATAPPNITVHGQVFKPTDPLYDTLMGKASTGDPFTEGVTEHRVDDTELDPRITNDATRTLGTSKPVAAASSDMMDQLLGKLGGTKTPVGAPPPRILSLKPEKIAPEQWGELRRYYGADELARLTGKTADEIRQLAPGPSRTPLGVEDKLNQNPDGIFKFLKDDQ